MGDICIFGQGFVGLPLALSFSLKGCRVTGVDVDEALVGRLGKGSTGLKEEYKGKQIDEILKEQLKAGRYKAVTNGAAAVKESAYIIVTVGIPFVGNSFLLSPLEQCCRAIGRDMKKGAVVLIRSTLIPGTTEDLIIPILEKESGMMAGKDFFIAYGPERIAEGRAFQEFEDMPALIGAADSKSIEKASELLNFICRGGIIMGSSIRAVETCKLIENVQRDVNIALSQELARFTEAMGLDIFELIAMANTHSRVSLMYPGPGVGGYCIPNAYHYLSEKAVKLGVHLELSQMAREKNHKMPELIIDNARKLLLRKGKELKHCKAAVFGLAMKDYSSDCRLSPALDICGLLIDNGAELKAYDPEVAIDLPFVAEKLDETLKDADLVLILVRQQGIDVSKIEEWLLDKGSTAVCMDLKGDIKDGCITENDRYWRI